MRLLNPEPKSTKESPTLDTGGAVPKVHCVKLTLQSSWLLQLSDFEKCSFILNDSFGDSKCTFVYWKLWEFCRRETSLTSFETGQFTERSICNLQFFLLASVINHEGQCMRAPPSGLQFHFKWDFFLLIFTHSSNTCAPSYGWIPHLPSPKHHSLHDLPPFSGDGT